MKWLVALAALAAAGASSPGCDVCLRGQCLARTYFYPGADAIVSHVADMDYDKNVMYFIDKTGKAIHLDDKKVYPVPMGSEQSSLFDLRIDHASGDMYYACTDVNDDKISVYVYQPNTNLTKRLDNTKLTNRGITGIWVHEGKVYFSDIRDYGLHYINGSSIVNIETFTNEFIRHVEFDKNGHMYVAALRSVKRLKKNEAVAVDLTHKVYVITTDKNGELYFFSWNLIYQLDLATDQLKEIGAYDITDISTAINKVMFDKYNNVISLHTSRRSPYIESWYYFKATSDQCSYKIVEDKLQISKLPPAPKTS